MIVVDTSVWIDHFNGRPTPAAATLRDIIAHRRALLMVGDLVLAEVLQGLPTGAEARRVAAALHACDIRPMVGAGIAVQAAGHVRTLRALGITVRKTITLLIGTFCIAETLPLLHTDRDFDPMERHLGLIAVPLLRPPAS